MLPDTGVIRLSMQKAAEAGGQKTQEEIKVMQNI